MTPPLPGRAASVVLVLAAVLLPACKKSESPAPATEKPAPAAAAKPAPAAAADLPEAVRKLFGRWLRADGGYVLELRGGDRSGVLQAAYFNPKSINVSRAVWMQGGPGLQVAVELNDVGYPGATYVLTYDAQGDRLAGQYTQPQMGQTFEVEFMRQPKP